MAMDSPASKCRLDDGYQGNKKDRVFSPLSISGILCECRGRSEPPRFQTYFLNIFEIYSSQRTGQHSNLNSEEAQVPQNAARRGIW